MTELRITTALFPSQPGVYLMKDRGGEIIYVGKAMNLRQRVRSYFSASGDSRPHVKFLMARVADIDFVVTDTEQEALLLENTLIKKHHPRYNLDLKDDKTYFSLKIDTREPFPRFVTVRKVQADGARYFGPYTSASAAREVIRSLCRMFPLRHYPLKTCMSRSRPCLYNQIGQCPAPCSGRISPEDYSVIVDGAVMFMEGKRGDLVREFKRRMSTAAEKMDYEEAARWRNLLRAMEVTLEKQKMVLSPVDTDVIGYSRSGSRMEIALLFYRGGALGGSRTYGFLWELDDMEGVASFVRQYYSGEVYIPDEILLPVRFDDAGVFSGILSGRKGGMVSLLSPGRGIKRSLVELAGKNAAAALQEHTDSSESVARNLQELKSRLFLNKTPDIMECYDISTIQGRHSVGSCASFRAGKPEKSLYRRYRIRSVQGQDDFAMLKEVFARRFSPGNVEKSGFPDLVVVDGGQGQLNALIEVVRELGLTGNFDMVSLAKSRVMKKNDHNADSLTRSDERIFIPGRRNPVVLKQNSAPLLMLAALRDEAHRFAVSYHRKLRGRAVLLSTLDSIEGIGPKRKKVLLEKFGSVSGIMNADAVDIASLPGFNADLAKRLLSVLGKGA